MPSAKYTRGIAAPLVAPRTDDFSDGTMYHLVVCGADYTKPQVDAALFGSFMGEVLSWKMLSEDIAYTGEYLSVFPLNRYFRDEPHKDIKFGQCGPRGEPLFTYTEKQFTTRQGKFFEQVDPGALSERVRQWMIETIGKAVPGDVVNIGFHCHGSKTGDLILGDTPVPARKIAEKAAGFRDGVQVNVHGSQCYGGLLVEAIQSLGAKDMFAESAAAWNELSWTAVRSVSNRCRQMAFSQPWVQSYSKIKLPRIRQTASGAPVTVQQHREWVSEAVRNITPGNHRPSQTYTSHLSSDKAAAEFLLEDMALRNHVDVTIDKQALVHRRRRAEWPLFSLPDLRRIQSNQQFAGDLEPALALDTLRMIDQHLWKPMNQEIPLPEDDWIAEEMRKVSRNSEGQVCSTKGINVRALLANAWYRAREQSTVFDLWISLSERSLICRNSGGLGNPISWYTNDRNVIAVAKILQCFSGIRKAMHGQPPVFPLQQRIENTWFWLAIQIVRSGVRQTGQIIDLLAWTEALGTFDEAAFFEMYPNGIQFNHDPAAFSHVSEARLAGPGNRYFGEWLPHSLGLEYSDERWIDGITRRLAHFGMIEEYYYRYFSVPPAEAITEAKQSAIISQRLISEPWIEPGRKHSGAWRSTDPEDPR